MSEAKACDYQPRHDTLKEILVELGKLYNAESTKPKVYNHLKESFQNFCGTAYLNDFYKDLGSDYGRGVSSYGGGTIQLLTKAAERICKAIINTTSWASSHDNTHKDHKDQTCGEKYFNALKKCLPELFPALFFLFFNVSTECNQIGGGQWSGQNVDGSRSSSQDLYQWLIVGSDSGLIKRGFSQGELHKSNNGQNVAQELKSAVSLKPNINDGSLQKVLCGFMFVCRWDDALTGHACLFLHKFCSKVLEGPESLLQKPYKDHSEAFKDVCKGLQSSLEPFIGGSSGLSAVCHDNTNLFDSLWDNGKFDKYCDWLKRNLHHIIEALENMSGESKTWNPISFNMGFTAGPFLYGFVPKEKTWQDDMTKGNLQGPIKGLIASLEKLEKALQTSSAGATAGGVTTGVLGAGGLGFGAAYATNAFGFQNFISGLLSSFLK